MTRSGEGMTEARAGLAARAAEWSFELVAIPSVTGTAEEAAFADRLRDLLVGSPAFSAHPEDVWTIPVAGDPLNRASVAALVRGQGWRTVVLTGHFDTVHIDDYGDLGPVARNPLELKEALQVRLAGASDAAEQRAFADLQGAKTSSLAADCWT